MQHPASDHGPVHESCRVAVVDERPLVRTSLAFALLRRGMRIEFVAGCLTEVLRAAPEQWPDVVVLGNGLPPPTLRLLPHLRSADRSVAVVVAVDSTPPVLPVEDALVDAVLGPQSGVDRLCRAIRRVRSGEHFVTGFEPSRTLQRLPRVELTRREREVLALLAAGASNMVIAERLDISVNTVRSHVQAVLGKLGAERRVAAVARAGVLGLLERTPA